MDPAVIGIVLVLGLLAFGVLQRRRGDEIDSRERVAREDERRKMREDFGVPEEEALSLEEVYRRCNLPPPGSATADPKKSLEN